MYARMMIFGVASRRRDADAQVNIPQIMEEIGEVVRLIPQERDQQCTVERIVHVDSLSDPGAGCVRCQSDPSRTDF